MADSTSSSPSPPFSELAYRIVGQFEGALRGGGDPRIEDYLTEAGPHRIKLLVELLHSDLELRFRRGQGVRVKDYLLRFPELSEAPDDLLNLIEVEIRLLSARGELVSLGEYERDFPRLADKLPKSIETQDMQSGSAGRAALRHVRRALYDGDRVVAGRYKLIEVLGEGGMGTVWLAEQTDPVTRRVALKLIRGGNDSMSVLARFDAERQALALMDHPCIAKMLDGGLTDQGQPFFVMELVRGLPITKFCDQEKLSLDQRLELFVQICQTVQHAHQKGVIHRDLKPSNILVSFQDGKPAPKVIDFGVAKALHVKLTEQTLFTQSGMMIGTLEYMAPEQAGVNSLDVDTRADIYSLGILLYELLTGELPFASQDLRRAAFAEMLRIICEQEPPRPSTKLASSAELPRVAQFRRIDPRKLTVLVRGELDWIVMKCLEKERNRRYESANALARDVERFLAHEPVEARPPTLSYRVRKFVRKHRIAVVAGSLVLFTLIAGIVGTSLAMLHAFEQERIALKMSEEEEKARKRAEQEKLVAEREKFTALSVERFFLTKILGQIDFDLQADTLLSSGRGIEEAERDPRLSQILDRASLELSDAKINSAFPNLPLTQAELLQSVGNLYLSIGGQRGDNYQKAIRFLKRSVALRENSSGMEEPDTLKARHDLARALGAAGKHSESITLLESVLASQVEKLGPDDRETLRTLNNLATAYLQNQQISQAIKLLERVRTSLGESPRAVDKSVIIALNNLANAYAINRQLDESFRLLESLKETCEVSFLPDHPATMLTTYTLGKAYWHKSQPDKAKPLFERVYQYRKKNYGEGHPDTLEALNNLALAAQATRDFSEAIRMLEEVLQIRKVRNESRHPEALNSLTNLGLSYMERGKALQNRSDLEKAIAVLDQARVEREATLGQDHPNTLTTINNLARAYQTAGNLPAALVQFERAAKGLEKIQYEHQFVQKIIPNTIAAYQEAAQWDKAESWRRKWLRVIEARYGKKHELYYIELQGLGMNLLAQKQWAEAEATLRQCLNLIGDSTTSEGFVIGTCCLLSEALLRQSNPEAQKFLARAYEGLNKQPTTPLGTERIVAGISRLVSYFNETKQSQEAAKWQGMRAQVQSLMQKDRPVSIR